MGVVTMGRIGPLLSNEECFCASKQAGLAFLIGIFHVLPVQISRNTQQHRVENTDTVDFVLENDFNLLKTRLTCTITCLTCPNQ
jgi:hypothetical protein